MSQPPPQISEVPNVQYQLQPILVKVRNKKKKLLFYSYIFVYLERFYYFMICITILKQEYFMHVDRT